MEFDRHRWFTSDDAPMWIGLDVGGANLKAADGRGRSESLPFELWRRPDELAVATLELLKGFERAPIALTMTGELADCYATKAEGVLAIVDAVTQAAGDLPVRIASIDDRWLSPEETQASPGVAAAANWRVAARLVALALAPRAGLWADVGSTTVDLIPFAGGRVTSRGETDTERLLNGELLYSGVRRTPVCAVVDWLPYRGRRCPVAAEWFATTADAWLLLGDLEADAQDVGTADGRPFTADHSLARLARCLCADTKNFTSDDALAAARAIAEKQCERLQSAAQSVAPNTRHLVLSGEGEFLARHALGGSVQATSLSEPLGSDASHPLPAHAAAVLASIEIGDTT